MNKFENALDALGVALFSEKAQLIFAIILNVVITLWVIGTWIVSLVQHQFELWYIFFGVLIVLSGMLVRIAYMECKRKS